MSFGIFEAATAEDLNHTRRKKLAGDRLAQAAAEVDHKLGPMLAKSTSVNDYHDRVRLAEKDFRNIVGKYLEGDSGFIAVAKKLEPHYTKRRSRTASRRKRSFDMDAPRSYTSQEEALEKEIRIDSLGIPYQNVKWDELAGEVLQQTPKGNWQLRPDYRETRENFGEPLMDAIYRNTTASRRVANVEWFEDWAQDGSGKVYTTIPDRNAPLSGPGAEVHQSENLGPGWHWNVFSPENPYGESGVEATPENAMAAAERLLGGGVTASRRVANNDLEDLKEFVHSLGAKTRKRRGRDGFTFPAASGANGAVSVRPNGEIVVETLIGGSGGMQSVYSPNEIDLVKDWIEKTVGGSYRLSRRKQANPWGSPDDALGSGYFPGWQTDHDEDGWWQINSPDGSDALVGEEDGSYTMRMDAETPEEAWAERMNFDEALQESEALHYRKSGSRRGRQRVASRNTQTRGLRRR